jgi:hypothetical protein
MELLNVTIGADIEYFLKDKTTQEIISAEGIVQGTKDSPFNFNPEDKHFATSLDNVMVEHCIPISNNHSDFVKNILLCQNYLENLDDRLCLAIQPSARLHERFLQTRNSQTFGCEPDFNCWLDGEPNPRPSSAVNNLRTAGFHVHIGYNDPSVEANLMLMKAFDTYVTLPSLLLEPDNERRELYGKAGAFRHKPYGMEARTLSSFFASTPTLMEWVYNQTQFAIQNNELLLHDVSVSEIINTNNKEMAERVCKEYNINYLMSA